MRYVLAFLLAFVPTVAFAADASFFGPIVPACAYTAGSAPCQACDLVYMVENVLKLFISLGVMAAALMFAYAGILYVTASANPGNKDSAKKLFWNVLIGLIFILAAFLIVDLILRTFTKQSFNVFTRIECVVNVASDGKFEFIPSGGDQSVVPVTPGGTTPAAGTLSDAEARRRLAAAGIGVSSSGNCTNPGNPRCTSLEGMPEATVARLIQIKQQCNCEVIVTGGTETGHKSHGPGRTEVDIRFSPETAKYLKDNASALGITQICTTAGDSQYRVACTFPESKRHLHVQFGGG